MIRKRQISPKKIGEGFEEWQKRKLKWLTKRKISSVAQVVKKMQIKAV